MPQPSSAIDSEAYLPGVLVGVPHASGQPLHAPRATEAGPMGAIGLCTLLPIVDASLFLSMFLLMTLSRDEEITSIMLAIYFSVNFH